jgi:hypothetical protein
MTEPHELRERLADAFQEQMADKDTHFRLENAGLLGDFVAEFAPSPEAGRAVDGFAFSDKTDGIWAGIAKTVRGYDKPTKGGKEDPDADHALVAEAFRGLIAAAGKHGKTKEARKLTELRDRAEARDARQDANRAFIEANPEIDQRELRAGWANKGKMVLIVIGQGRLARVPYEKRLRRRAAIGTVALGVRLGEYGEIEFRKKVERLGGAVGKSIVSRNPLSPVSGRRRRT